MIFWIFSFFLVGPFLVLCFSSDHLRNVRNRLQLLMSTFFFLFAFFFTKVFCRWKILANCKALNTYNFRMAFDFFLIFQVEVATSSLLHLSEQASNWIGFISYCELVAVL